MTMRIQSLNRGLLLLAIRRQDEFDDPTVMDNPRVEVVHGSV